MTGAELIAIERGRQRMAHGYTPGHDTEHSEGELIDAALAYAVASPDPVAGMDFWPWPPEQFKPGDHIRNLVKAGALIAAEIDRLQVIDGAASS